MLNAKRRRQPPSRLRFAPLLALGGSCLLPAALASEPELKFHSGFMRQAPDQPHGSGELALQALAAHQPLTAGRYAVQVRVNLVHAGEHSLDFQYRSSDQGLAPCLSAALLAELGLRLERLEAPLTADEQCLDLAARLPGAAVEFNSSRLQLDISIPQAALRRDVAGSVAPERWDDGINAGFVSYQASAQHSSQRGGPSRSQQDLYLNSGLNLGGWRLRSNQSLREDEHGQRRWTRSNTYAQTDLPGNWGTLTLGETFSNGEVFRSLPLKGVQLASDMGMLPDVLQSYAPVIRGVAQSRAKLEILQNGYPIYSTYVAAGPYEIDDLGIGGGSGELEIVLTEADGQVRRFIQPYSSLGSLLRAGVWRYTAAFGRYNAINGQDQPQLWQATLARGIDWQATLYGGVLGGDYYRAGLLGIGRDFGHFGAVSLDATHANTDLGQELGTVTGQSFAVRYGKTFQTRTNLRFAGYRYSTEGYRDFDEAVAQRNADHRYLGNRRSRVEASIQQPLGLRSSLSLTLTQDDYWNSDRQRRQYQFQFNTQHSNISYNLFASQSLSRDNFNDRMIGLSVSIPLGIGNSSSATFNLQQRAGRTSERASLSGSELDNRLGYRAAVSRDEQRRNSLELSANYHGAHASYGAGLTESRDLRTISVNASGALLAHEGGITLAPYLGETSALVEVPEIAGVGLENAPGASTNAKGYAVAPHLRPYRVNQLNLLTDQLGPEVEVENGTQPVVPRRGAIVKATFAARQVTRLILTLQDVNGKPLPFGTQVSDEQGNSLAIVGQGGQALIATGPHPQTLHVRWGKQGAQQCPLPIVPSQMEDRQGYRLQTLTCPPL
ncbi:MULTISPECIES: fimbria/pilus outer membrane usher protein [Pseudomonas]|jgi:outer membrane usher protein|uniref:fimbria/pilus outer membrane usher protein n=1 Tax=Pseudomonas TaxID=286 RepID=UPI002093BB5F|nr:MULTISPECIES: fimbria/pilus outer membrane usher protein [Pseudomonas]USS57405.1 fimbrial biogenesis outer membrane usher protein [Pseudomonas kermanshahensis]UVL68261.1 fimbrial biogenesis outer membrane usher protein [Pseudomonas sp. B21-031]